MLGLSVARHTEKKSAMRPVKRWERVQVIDILRGFSLLGVLLMNMGGFAGYHLPLDQMGLISQGATMFVTFFATGKFFTLFSFLFGWGMAIQMERAEQRGQPFASFYVRRLLVLLAIGLAHAILLWDGDILAKYAVLGFVLLLLRKSSDWTLLLLIVIGLLIPVLLNAPGPGVALREGYLDLWKPVTDRMMSGFQPNLFAEGAYWDLVRYRIKTIGFMFIYGPFWMTHVLSLFLLGLYVGRRRILRNVSEYLPLFRRFLWIALPLGLCLAGVQVYATRWREAIPESYQAVVFKISYVWGGAILCLGYISLIVLLSRREAWMERLAPLAAVGRMSLTNYLLHAIILTPIFYGYGLGLYGRLAPSITILMTFVIYRAQIALSNWWLARFRFGPAEWLWRTLTYGRFQPLTLSAEARRKHQRERIETLKTTANGGLGYQLVHRLTFLILLLPGLVFFVALAMNMGQGGGLSTLLDSIPVATDFTEDYLVNLVQGDLGTVRTLTTGPGARTVVSELAHAFPRSLGLLLVAQVLATLIGLPLGIVAGLRRHTRFSGLLVFLSVLGISTPSYFAGMLFIWFSVWLYRVSGADFIPIHGFGWDAHLILPALVLAARPAANVMRLGYNALTEIRDADFVRTAHAKGLRPRVVLFRHVLRNASVPLLTTLAVSLRFSLAILPIVEYIFSWGGMGQILLEALDLHDTATVVAMILPLAVLFVVTNLVLEVLYLLLDPRLRIKEAGAT